MNASAAFPKAALAFVFLWFLFGGIGHFVATDFFVSIVPPWVPDARLAVLVSGVFELLGAVGILIPATRRLAGAGLFLLVLAVTPANIHMLQHHEQFPAFPLWSLWLRMPMQVVLLAAIVIGTWPKPAVAH